MWQNQKFQTHTRDKHDGADDGEDKEAAEAEAAEDDGDMSWRAYVKQKEAGKQRSRTSQRGSSSSRQSMA